MRKIDEVVAALIPKYALVKTVRRSRSEFIEVNGMVLLSLSEAEQIASGEATLEQIVVRRSAAESWYPRRPG